MPDLRSDTSNPNNPTWGHPERHPHHGRPWLDPAPGDPSGGDGASMHGSAPAAGSARGVDAPAEAPAPVRLLDHSFAAPPPSMFVRLHPDTLTGIGSRLDPVGETFYLNINRVASARFRSSTRRDQNGRGADAQLIPEGTPCVELWIEGSPELPPEVQLFFPNLRSEYQRLMGIVQSRAI